jgi:hypothetical protein
MCSGRVSEDFVIQAFTRGAAGVLVAGCHLNDCHYIDASYQTKKGCSWPAKISNPRLSGLFFVPKKSWHKPTGGNQKE